MKTNKLNLYLIIFCLILIAYNFIALKEGFTYTNLKSFINIFLIKGEPLKCLDIVNDGANNKLQMAPCGNYTGQQWSANVTNDNTHYTLTNNFSKDSTNNPSCLDIINDGANNKVIMNKCADVTGQRWTIATNKKLQNDFSGPGQCLEIIDNGSLSMMPCSNAWGQFWVVK